jgi:diaminopimelate epimerase
VVAAARIARGEALRTGVVVHKLTGSGNDFVAFDGRDVAPADLTPAFIAAVCDRRHGVGADGVMLLAPPTDPDTHFAFHFWNSDGSPGPMCGNGALCATRLATVLRFAPADGEVRFTTGSGVHRGRLAGEDRSQIELPDCDLPVATPAIASAGGERNAMVGRPSVPHLVLEVDNLDEVDLAARGPLLRHDPALGPGGANVNWVSKAPDGSWRMRTYERGVEGETMACGTGSIACALALAATGRVESPVRIWTRSGLPLDISWARNGAKATGIRLVGEGRVVFRGILGSLPTDRA